MITIKKGHAGIHLIFEDQHLATIHKSSMQVIVNQNVFNMLECKIMEQIIKLSYIFLRSKKRRKDKDNVMTATLRGVDGDKVMPVSSSQVFNNFYTGFIHAGLSDERFMKYEYNTFEIDKDGDIVIHYKPIIWS